MKTKILILLFGAALCVATFTSEAIASSSSVGRVYVMSNKARNSVLIYDRGADGSLTFLQEAATKGQGTGVTLDPLQSQGSVAIRSDGKVLLVVNAASGELTAFRVTNAGVQFGSKVLSGGDFPVSVTVNNGLVYVLNQLGIPNISGFTVSDDAQLQSLASSTRALAGGALAQPAQVSFTPDGTRLIVTEKGTRLLDTFTVLGNGRTGGPFSQPSSGFTPFGFAFGPSNSVIVSEAENRLPMEATASSYRLTSTPQLQPVSPTVANQQTAACWIAVTADIAWVVNTGSATITSFQIGTGGSISVLDPVAASTGDGSSPIDTAASSDGSFLYVLLSATGQIAVYSINGSTLTPLPVVSGLPLSIQGIVAR
jgi:6-phosphogluconolactonase (cycloisomerase 2 family)